MNLWIYSFKSLSELKSFRVKIVVIIFFGSK